MPRMLRHKSIRAADRILSMLRRRWVKEGVDDAVIRHYANCREQGYHVSCGSYSVTFSEAATGGQLVLWWGETRSFDGAGAPLAHSPRILWRFDLADRLVDIIINCLNYGSPEAPHPLGALGGTTDA